MTGADVVRARKAVRMSRAELARQAGLDYGRIVSIERARAGWTGWREGELEAVTRVLKAGLEQAGQAGQLKVPVPTAFDDEQVWLDEWRGLEPGHLVRIQGHHRPYEQFKFGYYFKSPAQEYVQLYAVRNGGGRTVRPEKVLVQTVRGWTPATEVPS